MQVRWLGASLDLPAADFGGEVRFWRAISGSTVSPPLGDNREFASLEPFHGDPHLKVQRIDDGPGGIHLDLSTDDAATAVAEARAAGATPLSDDGDHVTLRSPAGLPFCIVRWRGESQRSRPIRWPGDAISIIDQVCIDVPEPMFDDEVRFWATVTGWAPTTEGTRGEFVRLHRDPQLTLGILLQRTGPDGDSDTGAGEPAAASAHLDLAANSVTDEVARHQDWGARVVAEFPDWTTMADPGGRTYCITARNPRTGQ